MHFNAFVEQSSVFQADFPQIALQTLPYQTDIFVPQVIYNLKTSAVPNYAMSEENLAADIKNWLRSGYETVILAGVDGVKITAEKLSGCGVYVAESERLKPIKPTLLYCL